MPLFVTVLQVYSCSGDQ